MRSTFPASETQACNDDHLLWGEYPPHKPGSSGRESALSESEAVRTDSRQLLRFRDSTREASFQGILNPQRSLLSGMLRVRTTRAPILRVRF